MHTLPAGARPANPITRIQALLRAIEPWYNWGSVNVERMDEIGKGRSAGEGEVSFFDLQWLGIHIGVQIGRTPKREG